MASENRAVRGADWAAPLRRALSQSPAGAAAWMAQHTRLLKSDTHSRVGLLELDRHPCFLKLYLAKSPLQRLGFRLGYGRGVHSFDAAQALLRSSLPVPVPRTCLLVPEGMLLLTEGIPDSQNLRELWRTRTTADRAAVLMRSAGNVLAALHGAGFSHGDCKWSNLLWGGENFYLVDLEAVRKTRRATGDAPLQHRQIRDLARFTVDAQEQGVDQAQYDIFLESYCAGANRARDQVAGEIKTAAAPIRRRHAKKNSLLQDSRSRPGQ